ncbi:hypothetical protein KZP23_15065 [Echinicola marina]|uniref:hypothetical protein n=1 Tax=Echinicola marina TaxID=2859768 RepID=UPI001CF61B04|nr:hypothetical protein [Echinicola marina]UCS92035.1 hypothetical protein KZP23_15065 [Echinicola marina]
MYDIGDDPWMERRAYDTPLFHWEEVSDDKLAFKAFTVTGELFDAFDLVKESSVRKKLVDHIPRTTERILVIK